MTKTELKQLLTDAGYEVITESQAGTEGNYTLYTVQTKRARNNVLRNHSFQIAEDSTGNAYWKSDDPLKGTFTEELQTYLDGLKSAGIIVGSAINLMNSDQQFGEVTAWWQDENGKVQRGKFFVDKDTNGNFQYKQM